MLSCYGRDILYPFADAARAVSGRKGCFPEKERDPVIYGIDDAASGQNTAVRGSMTSSPACRHCGHDGLSGRML